MMRNRSLSHYRIITLSHYKSVLFFDLYQAQKGYSRPIAFKRATVASSGGGGVFATSPGLEFLVSRKLPADALSAGR
jgi:hypothetical protein